MLSRRDVDTPVDIPEGAGRELDVADSALLACLARGADGAPCSIPIVEVGQ